MARWQWFHTFEFFIHLSHSPFLWSHLHIYALYFLMSVLFHLQPLVKILCNMMFQSWGTIRPLSFNALEALIMQSKHPHDASLLVFHENNINLCQWINQSWNQICLYLLRWIVFHKVKKTPSHYSHCSVCANDLTLCITYRRKIG